ncbi:MAG: AbrB/MazE/SpoVT family DNA-binding domain-containing protein [Clostridia bacterium]|nr:AbrB/MazE/SpoVT family DNA-binding domain-containing protein [Clostridia bacterium]
MFIETQISPDFTTVIPEPIRQRAGIKEGHFLIWDVSDKTGEIIALPSPISLKNREESHWQAGSPGVNITEEGKRRLDAWGDY